MTACTLLTVIAHPLRQASSTGAPRGRLGRMETHTAEVVDLDMSLASTAQLPQHL